jgi:hypothetical protein
MSVRAKFICNTISKQKFSKQDEGGATVILTPVVSGSEENKDFWRYTPSGKIEIQIKNEAAEKYFELGEEYYVDFVNPNELKIAEPVTTELSLKEQDLLNILAKNNKQLVDAINKEKAAKDNKCPDLETAIRNVGVESGEALMLVKLIQYLNGEKKLEEIS